jgi:hypothetical protein
LVRLQPLIDADVLRYEVGFGSEFKQPDGSVEINNFDSVLELLDRKVKEIIVETDSTESPIMYLTASQSMIDQINKRRTKDNVELINYKPNFREDIAKTKVYKGNRTSPKPFHFANLSMYIYNNYDCKLAIGMEADDLISIDNNILRSTSMATFENTPSQKGATPIICSRDKDLKITPGLHYSWACGKSPSHPVREIDKIGFLEEPKKGKLIGGGLKFFYAQVLMGDSTDNIPGLAGYGPVAAYNLLKDCVTEEEMYHTVRNTYLLNECPDEYLREQMNLLWIVQSLDVDGNPVMYEAPR